MLAPAQLAEIDATLDALGVTRERAQASVARLRTARLSLAEVDEALAALDSRFDTRPPEGEAAHARSWADERAARSSQPLPARRDDAVVVDAEELPPVLSSPPAPIAETDASAIIAAPSREPEAAGTAAGDPSREAPSALSEADLFGDVEAPDGSESLLGEPTIGGARIPRDPSSGALSPESSLDASASSDEGGARAAPRSPSGSLALELEGVPEEPLSPLASAPAPALEARASLEREAEGGASPEPSPLLGAGADLDAELADILADELEHPASERPAADDFDAEPTALFSADMFGASEEPSLDALVSELPPPDAGGALEIELDDAFLLDDAEEATAQRPPPASQRPPPLPSQSPPPSATPGSPSRPPASGKQGFLGRLLNRKG